MDSAIFQAFYLNNAGVVDALRRTFGQEIFWLFIASDTLTILSSVSPPVMAVAWGIFQRKTPVSAAPHEIVKFVAAVD